MKFRPLKVVISFISILALSSCAVYGTQFECSGGRGQRCTSVSKVNQMIDRGEIDIGEEETVLSGINKEEKEDFSLWMAGTKNEA